MLNHAFMKMANEFKIRCAGFQGIGECEEDAFHIAGGEGKEGDGLIRLCREREEARKAPRT